MRSALKEELKIQKQELEAKVESLELEMDDLYEQIGAIQILLGEDEATLRLRGTSVEVPTKSGKRQPIGYPKGKYAWEGYAKVILQEIGGRGKAKDVIEYAKKANPRMKEKTIVDSVRSILSTLGRDGKLVVEKAQIKSEGNVYALKEQ